MAFRRKVPRSVTACAVRSAVFVSARALYIRSRYQWPAKRLATVQSRPRGKRLIYGWVREASGYDSPRRVGTLPPPLRASERPIAIACSRLLTGLPDFPDLSLPSFISCIALLTFVAAFGPYCLLDDLIGIFFKLYFDRFDVSETKSLYLSTFAHKLMPEQVNWICSGSCVYLDLPQQSL